MKQTTKYAAIAGLIASVSLAVPEAHADLKHRYQFNDAPGSTTVADSVSGANGTLINTTGNSAFDGDRLTLGNDGSQGSNGDGAAPPTPITYEGDFVDLPNGLLTDLNTGAGNTQFTFEAWYTRTGNGGWMRLWDFGTSTNGEDYSNSGDGTAQLFLSPQSGAGTLRAVWRPDGAGENPVLDRPGVTPLDELTHVAFVWDETTTSARLYVNGVEVAASTSVPSTLAGAFFDQGVPLDVNNWLGRAQWDDPLFVGSFDEFRIWDEALTGETLLNNFANGPDDPDQQGPGAGALTGIEATSDGLDVVINATSQVNVNASYENLTNPIAVTTAAGIEYTTSNANVATVNGAGLVTGTGPGSAQITVDYQGQTDSLTVNVVVPPRPPAVLTHRYSFDDAVDSTVLADSVGTANGTVLGTVAFSGTGTASFPGDRASYIDLPNGVASDLGANGTLEAWVTFATTGGSWQRLFDFGNTTLGEDPVHPDLGGTGGYNGDASWFYAPRQGGITGASGGRYAFDPGPGGENPQINPPAALGAPIGEEFHMVATYNHAQRVAQLWINGQLVGQGGVLGDRPLSSLDDVNNWLGRSQWSGDANATATFNEFRVYSGVPSELEIAVSAAAGPDVEELVGDPGDPLSFAISAESNTAVQNGAPVPVTLIADFSAITGVNITSIPGVTLGTSNPNVVQVLTNPYRIVPVGPGTAQVTGSYNGQDATPLSFTVTADNRTLALEHRYTFDGNADDVVGGQAFNGTLVSTNANPGGVFEDGGLTLAGTGYVNLPNFLFSDYYFNGDEGNLSAITLEVFGSWAGGGNWQRILDFGTTDAGQDPAVGTTYSGQNYLLITPSSGAGTLRFGINDGVTGTLGQTDGAALGVNQDYHVVVVFDPNVGVVRLYRNGALAGVSVLPDSVRADLVAGFTILDNNVWLGRSQFNGDPFFQGRFEEFRIWRGPMSDARVAQNFACGPNNPDGCSLPGPAPTIVPGLIGDAITLSWPESALGFGLESTTDVGDSDSWAPVGAQPLTTDGTRTTTLTPAGPTIFRLKADN